VRRPPERRNHRACPDLFPETVIKVVEQLSDGFLVVGPRRDDVVFFVGHGLYPRMFCARRRCVYFVNVSRRDFPTFRLAPLPAPQPTCHNVLAECDRIIGLINV
jgi:hypothetical protein